MPADSRSTRRVDFGPVIGKIADYGVYTAIDRPEASKIARYCPIDTRRAG